MLWCRLCVGTMPYWWLIWPPLKTLHYSLFLGSQSLKTQHCILKYYLLQLWPVAISTHTFWWQIVYNSSVLQGQFIIQRKLMSYSYEFYVLYDNNNINNHYESLSSLLIKSCCAVFLHFLIASELKSSVNLISFI